MNGLVETETLWKLEHVSVYRTSQLDKQFWSENSLALKKEQIVSHFMCN